MKIDVIFLLSIYYIIPDLRCFSQNPQSKQSWLDAASTCYSHGSVLESNLTLLNNYIDANNLSSVWVGSYSVLMPWTEITGCFKISQNDNETREVTDILRDNLTAGVCQARCIGNTYFAFSERVARCWCLTSLIEKHSENSSRFCYGNSTESEIDFNVTYAITYRVLDSSDAGLLDTNKDNNCAKSSCNNTHQVFKSTSCRYSYLASYCRDGKDFAGLSFYDLVEKCKTRGSLPLLMHNNVCHTEHGNNNYWVGVQRLDVPAMNFPGLDIGSFDQLKNYTKDCAYTKGTEKLVSNGCDLETRNFFCTSISADQTEITPTDHQTSDVPEKANQTDEKGERHQTTDPLMLEDDKMKTVAIASIVSGTAVAIILVLVVTLICKRRSNVSKEHGFGNIPLSNPYDEIGSTQQSPHYIDIDMNDGLNEHYIPLQDNKRSNENYYVLEKIKESEELTNNKTTANQTHRDESAISTVTDDKLFQDEIRQFQPPSLNSSNIQSDKPTPYCITVLNTTETDIDPYVKNTKYDHLNQVVKINPSANEYDHLPMSTDEDLQTNANQSHIVNSNYNEVTLAASEDKHDEN